MSMTDQYLHMRSWQGLCALQFQSICTTACSVQRPQKNCPVAVLLKLSPQPAGRLRGDACHTLLTPLQTTNAAEPATRHVCCITFLHAHFCTSQKICQTADRAIQNKQTLLTAAPPLWGHRLPAPRLGRCPTRKAPCSTRYACRAGP